MLKKSAEMARLRQTCCLGLPSTLIVPQILEDLHRIVECDRMHFAWCDRLGNIVNAYFEKPDAQSLDWFQSHHQQFQDEAGFSLREHLLFGEAVSNLQLPPGFESTESFRYLYANLGIRPKTDAVIRDSYGPLGLIHFLRREADPVVRPDEEALLAQAIPYVAHAVSHRGSSEQSFVETGESVMLVYGPDGRLRHQSGKAKELCFYALADLDESLPWDAHLGSAQIDQAHEFLFRRIRHALSHHEVDMRPPAWNIRNRWGEFQVRAYVLHADASNEISYGVTLEKKTPLEVLLLGRLKAMPLSNRQREVCYLLARGVETVEIEKMLNIATTTLKEHSRAIYRKLGVQNRKGLLRLVLGGT